MSTAAGNPETTGRAADGRAMLVTVGGTVLELRTRPYGPRTGEKQDARFEFGLGGSGVNSGRFGAVNGVPTAVIGAQGRGWAGRVCQDLAAGYGLRLLLCGRDGGPGLSVVVPDGARGRTVFTERPAPPGVAELTPEMQQVLGRADLVLAGPMPAGAGARDLLTALPALAPRAFRALIPHRSLAADPAFPLVARGYHYVQVNADESRLLDGATRDVTLNARRLAFLAGEGATCAVTNGPGRGWLWCEDRWLPIDPPRVDVVDETGCGDSFAAAFLVGWRLLGLGVEGALDYAVRAAARTAGQVGVTSPLACDGIRTA